MALNKEGIREQAKQILDKFASALEEVEDESSEESYVDREDFERVEGEGEECDKSGIFKEKILKNAPESNEDFILVEKGDWK